jgi:hypothetical protein
MNVAYVTKNTVFLLCKTLLASADPAFLTNADPDMDLAFLTNADPEPIPDPDPNPGLRYTIFFE